MKALLIDHDDSFTYNLRNWLSPAFSVEVRSHRDLEVGSQNRINFESFNLIVLSPGPKSPNDYPHVKNFIQNLTPSKKVFGVCLGMQILNELAGGSVLAYTPPLHGKKSRLSVLHPQYSKFNGLQIARYHSLQCKVSETSEFEVVAVSDNDNLPMLVQHSFRNWLAVQFHPESFLTEKPELFLEHLKSWCRQ
jgi:anthranilate synthase/aminodeoxychorismate synthase-like glutamine amidotransferase